MRHAHRHSIQLAAAIVALTIAALPAVARYSVVSEALNPADITIGHSTLLTITITGPATQAPILPFVGGLELRVVSQSHRADPGTGATLTTIVVRVTPQMAGTFSIPGLAANIEPLTLKVEPDRLVADASSVPHTGATIPPVVAKPLADHGIQLMADGAAFVRLNVPKRQAYVGESIPIDIEVGMRSGFVNSLNGLPTLTGGDFTLNNLSRQPERSERTISGKPFGLFTWHSVMAAVKPGRFAFSVEVPLTVKFSTRPKAESRIDDLLGDPFLQNHFGPSVTKQVKVASPASDLAVVALPLANRPADFSGAVGSFAIKSDVAPVTAAAGDPLTLRLHVSGSGNFDRVDTAMLKSVEGWKTYPPRASFNASDTLGYQGEKVFEQPLIASGAGLRTLPGLAFSFFDPTLGRYQTVRSAALTVTIAKSLAETAMTAPAEASMPGAVGGSARTSVSSGQLRSDHAVTGALTNSLTPPYLRPPFLAVSCVLTLAFGGSFVALRRRVPQDRHRSMRVAGVVALLETAAGAGDATEFFGVARAALQATFTAREIGARLGGDGDDIRELFELADEIHYAGHALTAADYARWIRVVVRQMTGGNAA